MTATIKINNRACSHAVLTITYEDGKIENISLQKSELQAQLQSRHPVMVAIRNFIRQNNLNTLAAIKTGVEAATFEL